jgi:hypothetical protein
VLIPVTTSPSTAEFHRVKAPFVFSIEIFARGAEVVLTVYFHDQGSVVGGRFHCHRYRDGRRGREVMAAHADFDQLFRG